MKRNGYIIVGLIVTMGFLALLGLQGRYTSTMVKLRRDQFDENVKRSLDQAARDLERHETEQYLKHVIASYQKDLLSIDSTESNQPHKKVLGNPILMKIVARDSLMTLSHKADTQIVHKPIKLRMLPVQTEAISQSAQNFQRAVRNAYIYQEGVLDEVIYAILYSASQKSFKERINPQYLEACIRRELERNGVTLGFHFKVCASDGRVICQCSDYSEEGAEVTYTQTLFRNDPLQKMGVVIVHFPQQREYVMGVMHMMFPAMIFTLVLLVLFCFVLYLLMQQRKVNEMKNDFVNNMTHELKTPIASISLAAQMLTDKSINKSENMYDNLGGIISKEARRLRFQVEKVLQMSLYEHKNIALNLIELNSDKLIDNVVSTFAINVQQAGGSIETRLEAENPLVDVDEMHYTNVIYNIMENALKYRRNDVDLKLYIHTYNQSDNYIVEIADNGIGIHKDDIKHIFEKFYRVHTGNQHDVKGFGLGLAYVHKMIELHHGSIKVESQLGQGTKFIIILPNTKN